MMILIQWFLNKRLNIKLVTICTLSLALIVAPVVASYIPPKTQKPVPPQRRSDAGTTRGCSGGGLPLTVLASQSYVGLTSQHPTFAWFVPGDSAAKPVQFTIYEWVPNGKPKAVRRMSLQSSSGIMKLSPFSENELGLQPGKEFLWQIVIHCDPDNPSGDLVSEANIEVVEVPPTVQGELNKTVSSIERANIYARAGLWYDALGEALKLAKPTKLGEVGSTLLDDLVQSETPKTTSVLPKERDALQQQIENLKQIANNAR